jgi:FkbM family methyltransferase
MIRKLKIIVSAAINGLINYKIINGNVYKMPKSISRAFRPFINNKIAKEEVRLIRTACKDLINVIDIGANVGFLSLEMAQVAKGKIFCFEPNPYTFSKLVDLVSLNKTKGSDFNFICAAVGNNSNFVNFYVSERDYLGVMSSQVQTDPDAKLIKVPIVSLDDFFNEQELNIDFIKIDVEGAELFVLKGATQLLKKFAPKLLIEIHGPFLHSFGYTVSDLFKFLNELGYQSYNIETNQVLSLDEFTKNTGKYVKHPISGEDMSVEGYGIVLFLKND